MTAVLELESQTELDNRVDFKVFIVEENAWIYADKLKEELDNPDNPDLIHEIDRNFNLEDLEIFKKDKIIFIISNFKEDWQENAVRKIIDKAKENESKILLLTLNNIPLEFENEVYTFKAKDEKQLLMIPKILVGSLYIFGLVCICPCDIYNPLLAKGYGKISYFTYEFYPDELNRFEDYINKNVPKDIVSMFIQIETSLDGSLEICSKPISSIENIINFQDALFNIWLNENFENQKLKIHLITFN